MRKARPPIWLSFSPDDVFSFYALESKGDLMLCGAIQMDPINKSAHYRLAQLLQQTRRVEEAKREKSPTNFSLSSLATHGSSLERGDKLKFVGLFSARFLSLLHRLH